MGEMEFNRRRYYLENRGVRQLILVQDTFVSLASLMDEMIADGGKGVRGRYIDSCDS